MDIRILQGSKVRTINIEKVFDFSYESMLVINGKRFTRRQVDIMACLVSGDALAQSNKDIANLLLNDYDKAPRRKTIVAKAVETHIRNITDKINDSDEAHYNSRRIIKDFVKRSKNYDIVREHGERLIQRSIFQKVTRSLEGSSKKGVFINTYQGKEFSSLSVMREDLEWLWNVKFEEKKEFLKPWLENLKTDSVYEEEIVFFFASKEEMDFFEEGAQKIFFKENKNKKKTQSIIFICLEENKRKEKLEYYEGLLTLYKELYPQSEINKFLETYQQKRRNIFAFSPLKETFFLSKQKKLNLGALKVFGGIILILLFSFYMIKNHTIMSSPPANFISNFSLIPKHKFLMRPKIISKLNKILNVQSEEEQNPIVAIIGIGGAGKTTIARHYAYEYKESIVWELNSKNLKTLISSFEDLAVSLADLNEVNQKDYEKIPGDTDPHTRNIRLMNFVKKALKKQNNWILIYDDLRENLRSIQNYLFLEKDICGNGKIIVTTRNANIKFSISHKKTLEINSLTTQEKFLFFEKIAKENPQSKISENDLQLIVEKIPPYPLDFSIAAHGIVFGNLTPKDYLETLKSSHEQQNLHSNILKQIGNYEYTRRNIIINVVTRIINENPIFKEIIYCLAYIDFKNIPIVMLTRKYGKSTVNLFMQLMNQQSLITDKTLIGTHQVFSVHESFQEVILAHYIFPLTINEKNKLINKSSKILIDYAKELGITSKYIDDASVVKILSPHIISILKEKELSQENNAELLSLFGWINTLIGKFLEAEPYLIESLNIFKKIGTSKKLADAYWYLCANYNYTSRFIKENKFLKEAIIHYKNSKLTKTKNYSTALIHLGVSHMYLGNFKKAFYFINEGITAGLSIQDPYIVAFGRVYKGFTLNEKGKYEEAIINLEKALEFYKSVNNTRHQAWANFHLGFSNLFLKNYEDAIKNLEFSYSIYVEKLGKKFINSGRVASLLGVAYAYTGKINKAHKLLNLALEVFRNTYGENHPDTAALFQYMGIIECLERNNKIAKEYFKRAEEIYSNCKSHKGQLSKETIKEMVKNGLYQS